MYVKTFVRFYKESSQALGRRFEEFCKRFLVKCFREFNIIVERVGTIIKDGNFYFGAVVGVCKERIDMSAYKSASRERERKVAMCTYKELDSVVLEMVTDLLTIEGLTDNKEFAFSITKDDQDSNLLYNIKTVLQGNDQDSNLFCDTKTINSGNNQTEIEQNNEYDKNQIVKQDLIEELYLSTEEQSLIDSIIDNTSSTEIDVNSKTVPLGNNQTKKTLLKIEMSTITVPYFPLSHTSNLEDIINKDVKSLPETKIRICPACNGEHKGDGVKGWWGDGNYYAEKTYCLYCCERTFSRIPIVN
ncbi:40597_t:CDS:2, partial [Gigaspora margarita]